MGNQQSSQKNNSYITSVNLNNSNMTYLNNVENSTLLKCQSENNKNKSPFFFLQKTFVSDSQDQYKLLSKYLQKLSLQGLQTNSSQIIKIIKIYQQSQIGLCSNRYFIKALFEYSDITLRDQLRIRSSKNQYRNNNSLQKHYFRYEDLCSIMFACISSLFAVQKMRDNFKRYVQKNIFSNNQSFRHIDDLFNQFKYNIPLNLDRIIVLSDGTIKVIHPLLLDHQNRLNYSMKFFYSPQKMKDFVIQDGTKGRIFETALIILQCALIENQEQMGKIYNGYCINQNVLNQKIYEAINIYCEMENLNQQDMKLFSLIKRMTQILPQNRIGLDQCIKQTENLFQLNKKLKQSVNMKNIQNQKVYLTQTQRMSISQLDQLPDHRITMKVSPLHYSIQQSTNIKLRNQIKTTGRQISAEQTIFQKENQNPQIQVSSFQIITEDIKNYQKTRQNTSRNPVESLFISNNDQQESLKQNNQKCLLQLIGKNSNLYNTQKYNFLQSKFEYQKNYCNQIKNNQIDEKMQSFASSSCKKYKNSCDSKDSNEYKQFKYKKLIDQSLKNSSGKKYKKQVNGFIRQKLLRQDKKQKSERSLITASKFLDIDQIYLKYDFISKTRQYESNVYNGYQRYQKGSSISIKNKQNLLRTQSDKSENYNEIPFTYSLQNSIKQQQLRKCKQQQNVSSKKSEVLQKITPQHINEKLKRNKLLR